MLNTRIGENYNANDVINSNDLRKRLLSIDSRFRTNVMETSTNFQYRLEHTYRNVIRMKVSSIEIPNMFYTFMASKGNTTMKISTTDIDGITRYLTITIPDGNYTISELITLIQTQFNTGYRDPYGIFLQISLNANTGKITISHNGLSAYPVTLTTTVPTSGAGPITINFQPSGTVCYQNYNCGLGYNLGYRQRLYQLSTPTSTTPFNTYTLTGEAVVDIAGDTYCFLQVNDLQSVEHKTNQQYIQPLAKIIIREDKGAVIYDDGSTLMSNEIIFPSPQDFSVLNVKLLDAWGNILSLNGLDMSFTLEITEVLNTKLYDFYRNYIWLGTIPSVPYKTVEGSAAGLLRGRGP